MNQSQYKIATFRSVVIVMSLSTCGATPSWAQSDISATMTASPACGEAKDCGAEAEMLAHSGLMELDKGKVNDAERLARRAVQIYSKLNDQTERRALAQYVLAGSLDLSGKCKEAEIAYLDALSRFTQLNVHPDIVPQIYSDLAIIAARMDDMHKAEDYLAKATASELNCKRVNPNSRAMREDAVGHIRYATGHTSEAFKQFEKMVHTYGEDKTISTEIRAHIYQDYGQLSIDAGNYDEASAALHKSLQLFKRRDLDRVSVGVVDAHLARLTLVRGNKREAEEYLKTATATVQSLSSEFPAHVSTIAFFFGEFLRSEKRWAEARGRYLQALALLQHDPSSARNRLRTMESLIDTDRHLKLKDEAKGLKKQLKSVSEASTIETASGQTVDVMSLRQAYHAKSDSPEQ